MELIYPLAICCVAMENGPFIVDVPLKHGDFLVRYDKLPEGMKNGSNAGKTGNPLEMVDF